MEVFEFGPFRLDPAEHTFLRVDNGSVDPLPEKAFQTLAHLVRNHGRLVSKSDLMNTIWPDAFVEENNLEKCIHAIRQALGETPRDEKYIQTVRKHGYRFVADVRKIAVADGVTATGPRTAVAIAESTLPKPTRAEPIRLVFVGILGIALFAALVYLSGNSVGTSESNQENGPGTSNAEALILFEEASRFKGRATRSSAAESINNFKKAIELDPEFARAYAGLAKSHVELANLVDEPDKDCEVARAAAARALVLDNRLAEGYEALGLQNYRCDWDFEGAGRAFSRAIELDPNDASAHYNNAWYLSSIGRKGEALAESERALALEPDSNLIQLQQGLFLYFNRQYEESIVQLKSLSERTSGTIATGWVWLVCDMKGDQPQALEWFLKTFDPEKDHKKIDDFRSLYSSGGWQAVRIHQLDMEIKDPNYSKGKYFRIARVSTLIGEKDTAFEYLNRAFKRRDAQLLMLKQEPAFDSLRNDPRYKELLNQIGLDNSFE